jgi:DNA repair exonuclease SbcCD ATPase subunit
MSCCIGKTVAVDFCPFEDVEVDFSKPGLTVIEGQLASVPGCDSNGAGKSFLLEAPTWCLWGRCLREGYAGDEVIRLDKPGRTMVSTEVIGGPVHIRVVRYRKHALHKDKVFLYLDGKDVTRGTNAETQKAIEQALGADFLAYINSVAFGAREDVRSFFAASDGERKAVLEKILGHGIFTAAQQVTKLRLSELAGELANLEAERSSLSSRLAEAQATAESMASPEFDDIDLSVTQARYRVALLAGLLRKAEERLQMVAVDQELVSEAYKKSYAEYERAYDVVERQQNALTKERYQLDGSALPVARTKLESVLASIKRTTQLSGECPTCQQNIPHKHVQKIVQPLEKSAVDLRGEVESAKAKIAEIDTKLAALVFPDAPSDAAVRHIDAAYAAVAAEHAALVTAHGEAAVAADTLEHSTSSMSARVKSTRSRVDELAAALSATDDKHADLTRKVAQLEFWVQGFGNSGVKSFLIEAELPEINRRASTYAARMLGPGAYVRLTATKQLKTSKATREELTVECVIPRFTKTYRGASTGQKRRLNLSLILAFRDLVGARTVSPFSQLFADELFDGVDKSGCETISELLQEVAVQCPVVLVTHDPRLKQVGDRSYVVKHDGQSASLVARDAGAATTSQPARKGKSK